MTFNPSITALNGLRISLCQMRVVPGRPDRNAEMIIEEIEQAALRGIDVIAFPEMATTGYLIGDIFEDVSFLEDVARLNNEIVVATKIGVTAIFGTVILAKEKRGEDGRHRIHNAALVAQNGKLLGSSIKTLQPNYRFFNDDKHMYSMRKMAKEGPQDLKELLKPFCVSFGEREMRVGVILCEDMWHLDYGLNPTKILVENGAELIFNLSASPWTWQKNQKRHRVVKELLTSCRVPLCYVNNTGVQNVGKNLLIFDGSSAVYDQRGEILFEVSPYEAGAHDFVFSDSAQALAMRQTQDTAELYGAMRCATEAIASEHAVVVVGLSGGVDSAVAAAHFVDVLGPDRVVGINMPFLNLNSSTTQDMAKTVAENLGIRYEVHPIQDIVAAICEQSGVATGSHAYENVQARARKEILAATAARLEGVFSCNANKVEVALGYGTLYGDIAGFYAPLGDLVKREVRQIAHYLNQERFKREVIPPACIGQKPTAELAKGQYDPFDYGDTNRRGYHDEMIRAITEFRKNPEWFLELYAMKKLDAELRLDPGTIRRLFPDRQSFLADLEKSWRWFYRAYFKRIQCPPIPIFSKRAFGRDFEESLLPEHYTARYLALKEKLLRA